MDPALIHVYTGEGKGKTTAAIGLAVRALGHGLRVLLVRFLKPVEPPSGEIVFLQGTPGLDIISSGIGIIGERSEAEEVVLSLRETFGEVRRRAGEFDLVILDEINNTVHHGYLPLSELLDFLDARPEGVELVLTGRNAAPEVLARAHLVTRMEMVRHPLKSGVPARRGIEF
jgi:cob(I)alamin adenosyltransferase